MSSNILYVLNLQQVIYLPMIGWTNSITKNYLKFQCKQVRMYVGVHVSNSGFKCCVLKLQMKEVEKKSVKKNVTARDD
jgi:hypothetical protein